MPAKDPKAYAKTHYQQNKAKYSERCRAQRKRNHQYVQNDKQKKKCVMCGFDDYRALCYHHTDPTTKICGVWKMAGRSFAIKTIQAEIDKCIVLCSNCHAIEHHRDNH